MPFMDKKMVSLTWFDHFFIMVMVMAMVLEKRNIDISGMGSINCCSWLINLSCGQLQIRGGIEDNSEIIFLISQ